MTQLLFQREVLIDAPLTHVWQLVATESGLRQWWGNPISVEAREGGRCEEWRQEADRPSHWQGVVTLYAPPRQIMLTLRAQEPQSDWPELITISIALEAQGEKTHVHITQRAFGSPSLIGTADPRQPVDAHTKPRVPLAQLDRVPPGSLPMPAQLLPAGRVEPSSWLISRAQSDELALTWQGRLTSLTVASLAVASLVAQNS
ncbi:MAG: SRPBCC domain-containing protein [Caldilineaceae bacterium]|nr:SRPBCC domain-containing protein [Caldilineaceae bacterium]